jgi:glycosyltransferase involved in cell wall biosynthesis
MIEVTSPLKIGLNATAAVSGGGPTYWLNLLSALARVAPQHQFVLFVSARQTRFGANLPANFEVQRLPFKNVVERLTWEQVQLPQILKEQKIDVLLSPAELCPLFAPCPVIMAVQNVLPYVHVTKLGLKGRVRKYGFQLLTRLSIARSQHVFFVSETSRQLVSSYFKLPKAKSSVIYHGIAPEFFSKESGEISNDGFEQLPEQPYILSVSALYAHKGFETLIEAFARLRQSTPRFNAYQLVLAGSQVDQAYYTELENLIERLGLKEAVRFVGEVSYEFVPQLYRQAELFVFPSRAESFGLPLVEALAAGAPILVSDLAVAHEICGEAASYFTPGSVSELAHQMARLLDNPALRERQVTGGLARAQEFSWERCAAQTLHLLEKAVQDGQPRPADRLFTTAKLPETRQ